jgi:hypothetical protein
MGRAKLTIGHELIALFLRIGTRAAVPEQPLRDVKVVDVRIGSSDYLTELLISSPDLPGPGDETFEGAPDFNLVFRTKPVIELPAGAVVALQLVRIADRPCTCAYTVAADAPDRANNLCASCLASDALAHVPTDWREEAKDVRRLLGETIPPPDPGEVTDEVPGV